MTSETAQTLTGLRQCVAACDGRSPTGTAKFKERISASPEGVEEIFNGVNGLATSADGTRWKVRSWADFTVDNGVLIGDPAKFQGLSIREDGP